MRNKQLLIVVATIALFFQISYSNAQSTPNEKENFKIKGFHLDLRIQVMKLNALKDFATELASFGINTLIMEWEGTFPYETHPLIPNKYSYTKAEIAEFISHCNKLHIDVIPLQQCLGHLEYILKYPRYASQREDKKDVSQICPMESELNKKLFTDLFTEMAKSHPSKYFHIGGDEAYLFGKCEKCSKKIKEDGKSTLLIHHLKMATDILVSLGKIPVIWSDVANKYPDELNLLPKETIFLVWNYGWAVDKFGDPKKLTEKGFEVWGAPSLRSAPDNYYLTDWEKHFDNIKDFIPVCKSSGYNGVIMTSWSTSGIYTTVFEDKQTITDLIPIRNVYPISGFRILLAAYAQGLKENNGLDIEQFIITYCKNRFNLNKEDALSFWKALKGLPYEVIEGKVEKHKELTVEMLRDSTRQYQSTLNSLPVTNNKKEFEHYKLITDIRENYLSFKQVEFIVNGAEFNKEEIPTILRKLEVILKKDASIKKRFTDLNSKLLYPGEIEVENQTRIKRVQLLYDSLSKIKKCKKRLI
jgi:hypothetical protein